MFRFNFDAPDEEAQASNSSAAAAEEASSSACPAARVFSPDWAELSKFRAHKVRIGGEVFLISGTPANVGALTDIVAHTDIQSGVYEGGLKMWECAVDLVQWMQAQADRLPQATTDLVMEVRNSYAATDRFAFAYRLFCSSDAAMGFPLFML